MKGATLRIVPRPPATPQRVVDGVPAAARPFLDQIAELLVAAVVREQSPTAFKERPRLLKK